jgi:effector-binding domain-containing protein
VRFNLAIQVELDRANEQLRKLAAKEVVVDIKEVRKRRSIPQNSYYHLLVSYWGSQNGYSIEETKQLLKHEQLDLYGYTREGHTFFRSSADLSKEEMQQSIDRFIEYAESNGTDMPRAIDENFMTWAENYVEQHGRYL